MVTHLVTSGCSFSDSLGNRWPYYLGKLLSCNLYNRGQGSAGNLWISSSAIYQTNELLKQGISPENILVAVMWSGIDRKDCFIDQQTPNFLELVNVKNHQPNPLNFIDTEPNIRHPESTNAGYLFGAASCRFTAKLINKFKKQLVLKFFSDQALAIESYENFLKLQWFCKSNNIKLINQTYRELAYYPAHDGTILTQDKYNNITHLYDMIDFKNGVFWNNSKGLYEYTRDNNLEFGSDRIHPESSAHKEYVNNYLKAELHKRNII